MQPDFIYRSLLRCCKKARLPAPVLKQYELLAISPDTRFFSSLAYTATPCGWTVRWARSITGAQSMLTDRSIPVIVYDCCSVAEDWTASIARLRLVSEDPCIVMAVRLVSEELWRDAIARDVYDVVCRTGNGNSLVATLEFAWQWNTDRRRRLTRLPGRKADYDTYCSQMQTHRHSASSTNVLQHDYFT